MKDLFGNDITQKNEVSRDKLASMLQANLKGITLEELVGLLTNEFKEIIEYARLSKGQRACQKTSLLFNPHRLDTKTNSSKRSLYEAFQTDNFIDGLARAVLFKKGKVSELLYQVLQLGINGIQYVNEFPPHVARDIFMEYHLNANSKVLDPCGGWGGRLIGASVVAGYYRCYEPATKTNEGLKNLYDFIRSMNDEFKAYIICQPYEDSKVRLNYYDFALTSPPYYDTEEYTEEETNSLNRYPNFMQWRDGFFIPMIEKTMKQLKDTGTFMLNIGSRTYPLNEILMENFGDTYDIERKGNLLSGRSGLKADGKEGETFYAISKK